jgi:DNA-binding transcriptional regulator LsrR (DeoR family)
MSSRVIEACNLYNNNLSYNEIMKIMRISNPTLIKYLKTGRKLNKCNYKTQYELGEEHFVQAINLWNDGIKSTIEIGKKLNMNCTSIIKILKKGKEQGLCDYIPIIGGRTKNK